MNILQVKGPWPVIVLQGEERGERGRRGWSPWRRPGWVGRGQREDCCCIGMRTERGSLARPDSEL